jgi:hypothetical protein
MPAPLPLTQASVIPGLTQNLENHQCSLDPGSEAGMTQGLRIFACA